VTARLLLGREPLDSDEEELLLESQCGGRILGVAEKAEWTGGFGGGDVEEERGEGEEA